MWQSKYFQLIGVIGLQRQPNCYGAKYELSLRLCLPTNIILKRNSLPWLHEEYHGQQFPYLARASLRNPLYLFTIHQQDAYIKALASQQCRLQMQEQDQCYSLYTSLLVCSNRQHQLVAVERYLSKPRTLRMPMPSNFFPIILYFHPRYHLLSSNTSILGRQLRLHILLHLLHN